MALTDEQMEDYRKRIEKIERTNQLHGKISLWSMAIVIVLLILYAIFKPNI